MKFTVKHSEFLSALNAIKFAVPGRPVMPILSYVKFDASGDKLSVTGTDLAVSMTRFVGAEIDDPEPVLIHYTKLLDWISRADADTHLIEASATDVKIKSGKASMKMSTLNAGEYPVLATDNANRIATFEYEASAWKQSVDAVALAAAKDDNRPVLMGILVEWNPDGIRFIGANGYVAGFSTNRDSLGQGSVVVPAISLPRALSALGDGKLVFEQYKNAVRLSSEIGSATLLIVDGKYPDVLSLVPKSYQLSIAVDNQSLSGALRRAEMIARNANNTVILSIRGENELLITAESQEDGSMEDSVITERVTMIDPPMRASYNVKYLLDALSAVGTGIVFLNYNDPTRPLTVTGDIASYVIMPMSTR